MGDDDRLIPTSISSEFRNTLDDIRKAFNRSKCSPKSGRAFIPNPEIERIWTPERRRILIKELCLQSPKIDEYLEKNMIKFLSILVHIHFGEWSILKEKFVNNFMKDDDEDELRHKWDEKLPFNDENKSLLDPLGEETQDAFLKNQYEFLAIVLKEKEEEEESGHEIYSDSRPLPFSVESSLGDGVTASTIVPGHFYYRKARQWHINAKEVVVARKTFPYKPEFDKERNNYEDMQKCKLKHQCVTSNLLTFEYGSVYSIIQDRADLNLGDLFLRKHIESREHGFSPRILFRNLMGIVGAIKYLHSQMEENSYIVHMDLKPDNILVFWSEKDTMVWKINDFGLSVFKSLPDTGVSSATRARRERGPYQAPEVQLKDEKSVGRGSDLWSLGCIAIDVFAYILGGSTLVKEEIWERKRDSEYCCYYENILDPDTKTKSQRLKPIIKDWMQELCKLPDPHADWISAFVEHILWLLVVDPKRGPAGEVERKFLAVQCRIGEVPETKQRMWDWTKRNRSSSASLPTGNTPVASNPSLVTQKLDSQLPVQGIEVERAVKTQSSDTVKDPVIEKALGYVRKDFRLVITARNKLEMWLKSNEGKTLWICVSTGFINPDKWKDCALILQHKLLKAGHLVLFYSCKLWPRPKGVNYMVHKFLNQMTAYEGITTNDELPSDFDLGVALEEFESRLKSLSKSYSKPIIGIFHEISQFDSQYEVFKQCLTLLFEKQAECHIKMLFITYGRSRTLSECIKEKNDKIFVESETPSGSLWNLNIPDY